MFVSSVDRCVFVCGSVFFPSAGYIFFRLQFVLFFVCNFNCFSYVCVFFRLPVFFCFVCTLVVVSCAGGMFFRMRVFFVSYVCECFFSSACLFFFRLHMCFFFSAY